MGYQVALSPLARRDLRDIVRYISLDSPERAVAFGQFLVSSVKRLSDYPEMGRIVPEFDDPLIREIIVRSSRDLSHRSRRMPSGRCPILARRTRKSGDRTPPRLLREQRRRNWGAEITLRDSGQDGLRDPGR